MAKKTYMGKNSLLRLPVLGNIDNDMEILTNSYAIAFDSINSTMLTPQMGQHEPTTEREIRYRYGELKRIAKKYCPSKIKVIRKLEALSIAKAHNQITDRQYLAQIRHIIHSNGLNPQLMMMTENRINEAERIGKPMFSIPQFDFFPKKRTGGRKHGPGRRPKKNPGVNLINKMFGVGSKW